MKTNAWQEEKCRKGIMDIKLEETCRAEQEIAAARAVAAWFDLSDKRLEELAARFPPPQEWFDEKEECPF